MGGTLAATRGYRTLIAISSSYAIITRPTALPRATFPVTIFLHEGFDEMVEKLQGQSRGDQCGTWCYARQMQITP
jgi:hypothetical protein